MVGEGEIEEGFLIQLAFELPDNTKAGLGLEQEGDRP